MPSPIDPKSFAQGSARTPAEIAADILNFPLSKSPSEPLDRQKDYGKNTFAKQLGAVVNEMDDLPDGGDTTDILRDSTVAFERLLTGLDALRKAKPLSHEQTAVLKKSLRLIELLAKEANELAISEITQHKGRDLLENAIREKNQPELSPFDPDWQEDMRSKHTAEYVKLVTESKNLRGEVKTLFKELAAALGIALDEGPAVGQN